MKEALAVGMNKAIKGVAKEAQLTKGLLRRFSSYSYRKPAVL